MSCSSQAAQTAVAKPASATRQSIATPVTTTHLAGGFNLKRTSGDALPLRGPV